jgi:hypothetical protein
MELRGNLTEPISELACYIAHTIRLLEVTKGSVLYRIL